MIKNPRPFVVLILFAAFVVFAFAPQIKAQPDPVVNERMAPEVRAALTNLTNGEMTTVIVTLNDQVDRKKFKEITGKGRQKAAVKALKDKASKSQKQITQYLTKMATQGQVESFDSLWSLNGISVTATGAVIEELAARPDVLLITPDELVIVPTIAQNLLAAENNLSFVQAPSLWNAGIYGQGIVVANMDSGVDLTHADLSNSWRGGTNSWFDPYGEHPTTPTDLSGHGTWTMGVMVGGDSGGSTIGIAPQAQWIAVKIFDDRGASTATAIHQGFQWLLDPDGNPETADAPDVVNNSWTLGYPGCNLEFELDLASLRAAGIIPVFAAGNFGPTLGSSTSPANNPSALAVGAIDNNDAVISDSSRGPSSCGEAPTVFPELVAPGSGIRTADLHGTYTNVSGTSLAAPHVSGGIALLLSAIGNLSPEIQQSALIAGAVDTGSTGPDENTGNGRLDLLAAYQWLQNNIPDQPPPAIINLALNQPVEVSSYNKLSQSGAASVDGDLTTFWRTKKGSTLPSEWIKVDLGSSQTIDKVVLQWGTNYAKSYTVQISEDNISWTNVATITNGDGAEDTVTFTASLARYVMVDSTVWRNNTRRSYLPEFEVYNSGDTGTGPPPPPPPTTSTAIWVWVALLLNCR